MLAIRACESDSALERQNRAARVLRSKVRGALLPVLPRLWGLNGFDDNVFFICCHTLSWSWLS